MLFPTLTFALFFTVVFAAAWVLRGDNRARIGVLVLASYVFYGWWDWRFTLLLAASSLFNWLAGMGIAAATDEPVRRRIVTGAVACNLAVLGFFKYFDFFTASVNDGLAALGVQASVPVLGILLPVGISFFTFHGISYVVDLYRGRLARPVGLPEMLLYIAFFPQLVAGPIVRASHFMPQLARAPDPADIRATFAFLLILGGLFKKVIVANDIATLYVDDVFFDPSRHGAATLLLAAYGYAVQIYCDFSAYTDIAIGLAALLGYHFPQNFDQPYRAASLREFWRRWHISLSTWLRDYLYIPLGGDRRPYRNLLATMLLGGLWHGAAWTFVAWGLLHGIGLAVERLLFGRSTPSSFAGRALGVLVTFHLVCLAWVFFRAADFATALAFLGGLARFDMPGAGPSTYVLLLIAGGLAAQFLPARRMAIAERIALGIPVPVQGALLGLGIVAIAALGPRGVAPFIYFQF